MPLTASITIERKPPDAKAHAAIIRKAFLDTASQPITASRAAAVTGLPIDRCRDALMHLYGAYPGEITVDNSGELQFRFSSLSDRRPTLRTPWLIRLTKPLAAWYARHQDKFLAALTFPLAPPVCFSILGNLLAYMDAMTNKTYGLSGGWLLLLLPLHLVAAFGMVFSGIGFVMTALMLSLPLAGLTALAGAVAMLAYPFQHHAKPAHFLFFIPFSALMGFIGIAMLMWFGAGFRNAVLGDGNAWARKTWRFIGNLLFGPPPADDDLVDERRLTALIEKQHGVLSRMDVMACFGWTLSQAERELTRILLDYGGEIAVSPKGAVLFRFQLDQPPGDRPNLKPIYDRSPDIPPFWALQPGEVVPFALLLLAAFVGLWLHPHLDLFPVPETYHRLAAILPKKQNNLPMMQGFGAWPFLLVLVPNALRALPWAWQQWRWSRLAAWWPLLRIAAEHPEGQYVPTVRTELLTALGGTVDPLKTSADGAFWVTFPTHELEQADARRARQALANGARSLAAAIGAEMV
jgi:hypothetical protein